MPRIPEGIQTEMLGGALSIDFEVIADSVNGITGGRSKGWHTERTGDNFTGITIDKDILICTGGDAAVPQSIPVAKDALQVRVFGVGENGGDVLYAVQAIESMGDGFRKLLLERVGGSSSLTLTIDDLPSTFTPQVAVEVGGWTITPSIITAPMSIWQTNNATARIAGDIDNGFRVYMTALSQGTGYVIIRAQHGKEYADEIIEFTAEGSG